jgi:hypothetical protein
MQQTVWLPWIPFYERMRVLPIYSQNPISPNLRWNLLGSEADRVKYQGKLWRFLVSGIARVNISIVSPLSKAAPYPISFDDFDNPIEYCA